MEAWFDKPDAKFIFQLKLYTETLVTSKDPKVIHMMFLQVRTHRPGGTSHAACSISDVYLRLQAVYNVITGTYPATDKEAVALAALQFQAKFGAHNSSSHKPGFLTNMIQEFIPGPHLEKRVQAVADWEKLLFHKHAFSTSTTPREGYLESLKKREYYGAVLFAVKQRYDRAMPKRVFLAIGRQGILLLRIPKSFTEGDMETLARFNLSDIYRWAYKTGQSFYFEVKVDGGEANPVYSFDTPEGKHMSDMLTDYAMALLREMGLNPDGTRRAKGKAGQAAAAAEATSAAAAEEAPAPEQMPTKAAMASDEATYAAVGGQAGALASAATRSGDAAEGAGAALVQAADAGAAAGPEPSPVESGPAEAFDLPMPEGWSRVLDEGSGQYYFFSSTTGESVWSYDEIPGTGKAEVQAQAAEAPQ
jgi:hypothetical protein